jgi:hypothetical protein
MPEADRGHAERALQVNHFLDRLHCAERLGQRHIANWQKRSMS